ncbi:MAG TPA: BBP7 family outer membrane beta-barrel protein [Gemmataceae bacterium]|nr:BBP7 family outer membrane beta-barrel protein [Gemmataceae bacterium]
MIRRKIWATATCCLALAGAAQAQTGSTPKASLGAPKTDSYIARGAAPGYPQYSPRSYTAPLPPGYAAPQPNLGTSPAPGPMAPTAPVQMVEQPAMSQPEVDGSLTFAADTVPTLPAPTSPSPIQVNPKGGIGAPMTTPMPMPMSTPMGAPMGTVPMQMPMGTMAEGIPVPTGPLVSGPINGGPIMDTGLSGSPFLDSFGGGMPAMWVTGEYLNWRMRGANVPVLVTTAPVGSPGTLNDAASLAAYGGTDRETDWQSGFRIRAGTWLENGAGLDVGVFTVLRNKNNFAFGSNGDPGIFRPFFNTSTGSEDAGLVSFVDPIAGPILTGRVGIQTTTDLFGAEANYRTGWTTGLGGRLDALIGYRYVRFRDSISIQSDSNTAIAAGAAPAGTHITVYDRFTGLNQFNGGQIGFAGEWQTGSMTFGLRATIAAGVNCQNVDIAGTATATPPSGTPIVSSGGLLALPSNIGSHDRNVFSVVPEVGVTVGYQLTSNLRVFGGYNVMSFTNVVRGGEQIDRRINGTFIPDPTTGTAAGVGVPNPLFQHRDTDFYMHGWTAGLEWRW